MTTLMRPASGADVMLHYNAANERVLKVQGRSATLYLHGLSDYPLVEKADAGGTSFSETRYIYGLGGLIAYQRNDELAFVLRDHLGSTRVSVSSDGTSGVGYSYDALGNLIDQRTFGVSMTDLAYRYTGQEYDRETGLHNFRARLYDSDLFRFYATDPAGQQHSPYAFVGNSPLMFRDPTGMFGDPVVAPLLTVIAPTNPITAILAVAWTLFSTTVIAPTMFQAAPMVQPPQSYPSADYYRNSIEFRNQQMQFGAEQKMARAEEITVFGDEAIGATKAVSFQEAFAGLIATGSAIDALYPRSMAQLRDMPYEDFMQEVEGRNEALYTMTELATMGVGGGPAIGGLLRPTITRAFVQHFHHAIPKFLGGLENQVYSKKIFSYIHREYHTLINKYLSKEFGMIDNAGREKWLNEFATNPESQVKAFDAVLKAAREIDVKYGTNITQDFWQNLMRGNYINFIR